MRNFIFMLMLCFCSVANAATITITLTKDDSTTETSTLTVSEIDLDVLLTDMKDITLWGKDAYVGKIHRMKSILAEKSGKGGLNSTDQWLATVVTELKAGDSALLDTAAKKEDDAKNIGGVEK